MTEMEIMWGGGIVPIGTILQFISANCPTNYLICDGRTYDTTEYSKLYEILGTNTTPNLVGRFLVMYSQDTSDEQFSEMQHIGGVRTNTLTASNIPKSYVTTSPTKFTKDGWEHQPLLLAHYMARKTTGANGWGSLLQIKSDQSDMITTAESSNNQYFVGKDKPTSITNLPPYFTVNYIIRAK